MIETIYAFTLLTVGLPLAYLYLLAFASVRTHTATPSSNPKHRFAIAIPAHNEAAVIGRTITSLRKLKYPSHLFDIFVVADHCSDNTAEVARTAGAIVHERHEKPRGSKGAVLRWLFARILHNPIPNSETPNPYDAVVILDADTLVDPQFLRVMDARLSAGAQAIQGRHCISNPQDGWFPALTWAMFMVDNRFQNQGRTNLGLSAKHMGDSICFRVEVLRELGWGEGLTEDYAFRQMLLLQGIKIQYEPAAVGYGEAPTSWQIARAQRARWLRGTHESSRQYARLLLKTGLRRLDPALLDGAIQAYLPSYSTLTLLAGMLWLFAAAFRLSGQSISIIPVTALLSALLLYPLFGLALERAPARAYIAILSGPFFILWRTWLAANARFGQRSVTWVRTPRRSS